MLKKIDTSAGKATCHHICGCKWVGSMITLDIRKFRAGEQNYNRNLEV